MPTLADLNRQKRDIAYSGQADVGDVPWLYELYAQQAAANAPAGIGDQAGMAAENAAPNPQSVALGGGGVGGGAGGAADTGLPGPGQTGWGVGADQAFRDWDMGGRGAEALGDFGTGESGYVDLSGPFGYVLDAVKYGLPFPLSFVAGAAEAGIRGANAGLLDSQLEEAGFSEGLSGWQQIGAALGFNEYGTGSGAGNLAGSAAAQRAAYGGDQSFNSLSGSGETYRTSPSGPTARVGGGGAAESSYRDVGSGIAASINARGEITSAAPARDEREGGQAGEGGGRGGRGGCFVGDTHILMADGSRKKIRLIEAGDEVMAFDGLGALQPRKVVRTFKFDNRIPIRVYFGGGSGVVVTPVHRFLIPSGAFVEIGTLKPGDELVDADGRPVRILEINRDAKRTTVYNFEVEGLHTYVAKGLRVHNVKIHDGGVIHGSPGEEVDATLMAGEGVLSPEAMDALGPGFVHGVNMIAKMMSGR